MDYFCTVHNTPFFKKGKMKGFAHPIGDTGEWCNMPEAPETERETAVKKEIHETAKAPTPAPAVKPDMTKDDWAEKDRITRHSIECQTAYNGIIQLAATGLPASDKAMAVKLQAALDAALDWALAHLKPSTTTTTDLQTNVGAKKEEKPSDVSNEPEFKNPTEFYNECFNLSRKRISSGSTFP